MKERIIKFRAWDIESKEMVYKPVVSSFDWTKGSQGGTHETLMQFIETRADGTDIYEKDIVKIYGSKELKLVGYDSRRQKYCAIYPTGEVMEDIKWGSPISVIGNLYENPELLAP